MTEIALAYSSIDKARAEAIARVLAALGYTLSAQPLTPAGVDTAAALVVFWSSGSVNSIPINQLAAQASANRKLVCVRAGTADPPAAYALVALHDLSRWTGSLEAPELRTFLQHIMRMAPSQNAQQQQAAFMPAPSAPRPPTNIPVGNAAPFAFAGPNSVTRPMPAQPQFAPQLQPAPQQPVQAAPQPMAQRAPEPAPQPVRRAPPLPETPAASPRRAVRLADERPAVQRRVAERRRAAGGGVARVAFGAIAVSVIAGAAVAAFNYDPGQQRTASAAPGAGATNIAVTPNALVAPGPTPGAVTDAAPEPAPAAGVQVASAAPLPAALAPAEASATVQSARGWTASLPTMPNAARTVPVSGTPAPTAPVLSTRHTRSGIKLTPIDAAPTAVGIVAVDNANLGSGETANRLAANPNRPRTAEEERAWIRKNGDYGPSQ